MNKIKFSVENAELIDERKSSSFSILKIDFFASGKNLHETYVSEETLRKTASTIYNCPLVWAYDPIMDDIYTHSPQQVPCGFVPMNSEVEYKKTEDGRTMLSVFTYVWKKYSGKFLEFFKRDGDKPVSVEVSVYDAVEREDGLTELVDFVYEAITILGTYVTPAIPDACASVVRFSSEEKEEYAKVYRKEFSSKYDEIDFSIPTKVKNNVRKGLELNKQHGKGGTSVSLSIARFMQNNEKITPEKARTVAKFFQKHRNTDIETNPPNDQFVAWMLFGGNEAKKWIIPVVDQMNHIDDKRMSYFSEAKENVVMEDEKDMMTDEEMKQKHEEHMAEEEQKEEQPKETAQEEFEASESEKEEAQEKEEETPEEEAKEEEFEASETEEKSETAEEDGKEDDHETQRMSLDEYVDTSALLAMLQSETAHNAELAAECEKPAPSEMNMGVLFAGLFAKCRKMAEKIESMEADYQALKEFKAKTIHEQMAFAVDAILKEVEDVMPRERINAFREQANDLSIENLEGWKNAVRAEAYTYAKGKNTSDGITRVGMPFGDNKKTTNSLWG